MSWKVKARARTGEWDLGTSEKGTEQIAVLFDYLDGNGEAGSITWFGYFTDGTWQRTLDSLRYMGWQGDDLGVLDGLDTNEVELVLDEETYQGKTRVKVQWVNRLQALALKAPMDPAQRQSFAQRMRGRVAEHNQSNGQRRAAPAAQPRTSRAPRSPAGDGEPPSGYVGPHPGDDDIPF